MVMPMMWILWDIHSLCSQKFSVINTILQFGDTYHFASIFECIDSSCKDLSEKYAFEHAAIAIMILNSHSAAP